MLYLRCWRPPLCRSPHLCKKSPVRRASVFADNYEKRPKTCAELRISGIFGNLGAIESGRVSAGAGGQKKKRTGEVRFFFQLLPVLPASVVSRRHQRSRRRRNGCSHQFSAMHGHRIPDIFYRRCWLVTACGQLHRSDLPDRIVAHGL